jgi:hypothetical protein
MPPPHVWIQFVVDGTTDRHWRAWPSVPGPGDRVQLLGQVERDVMRVVWHEAESHGSATPILDRVTVHLGIVRSVPTGDPE